MKKINFNFIKFIITSVALFMSFTASAQLTAVLQRGETPQAFYGVDALKEALEAAGDGEQIFLSSGTFNLTEISKAVKIQGTGATHICGTLNLQENASGLEMDGIQFINEVRTNKLKNAKFNRCVFKSYFAGNYQSTDRISNSIFTSCKFVGEAKLFNQSTNTNNYIYNCILSHIYNISSSANPLFDNCIITKGESDVNSSGSFMNCIFLEQCPRGKNMTYTNVIIPSDGIQPASEAYKENVTLLTKSEIMALFKNTDNYEMTDDAASKYLGSDGNQIGVHGGAFPYALIPALPTITASKISSKVGADGKLSVSITVETYK